MEGSFSSPRGNVTMFKSRKGWSWEKKTRLLNWLIVQCIRGYNHNQWVQTQVMYIYLTIKKRMAFCRTVQSRVQQRLSFPSLEIIKLWLNNNLEEMLQKGFQLPVTVEQFHHLGLFPGWSSIILTVVICGIRERPTPILFARDCLFPKENESRYTDFKDPGLPPSALLLCLGLIQTVSRSVYRLWFPGES